MEHEQCDWSQFALLPVDVQRSFWPGGGRPDFPDFAANVARLLVLRRGEGLEVIHVRSRFKPDKSDWMLMYRLRVPASHHACIGCPTWLPGGRGRGLLCRPPGEARTHAG
jgi:nicotinamidase-related amidase